VTAKRGRWLTRASTRITTSGDTSDVEEFTTLQTVRSEAEAELLCGLLRDAGIRCMHRPTNQAAGAMDGASSSFGSREVVVNAADAEEAHAVLAARPE
jgi:Putative prokaryotic signal transducing protein